MSNYVNMVMNDDGCTRNKFHYCTFFSEEGYRYVWIATYLGRLRADHGCCQAFITEAFGGIFTGFTAF